MIQWGVFVVNDRASYPGHQALALYGRKPDAIRYWWQHHTWERRLIVVEVRR